MWHNVPFSLPNIIVTVLIRWRLNEQHERRSVVSPAVSSDMMNFRITGPTGTAATIQMKPTDTVGDLYDSVAISFDLVETSFDLLFGYPPQLCSLDPDIPLQGATISPNERIKVQLADQRGQQAEGKGQMTTSKKRGSKKKAASSSSSSSASGAVGSPFGARVMTLSGPVSSSGGPSNKRRAASSSRPRKRSRGSAAGAGGEDAADTGAGVAVSEGDRYAELTNALMSATSGGGSGQDQALRDVFRNAVAHQYKSSQDVARLAATFAGQYTLEDCQEVRVLQSGQCSKMRVRYPKNVGTSMGDAAGRSVYTDVVDIVDVASMRAAMMLALVDTTPGGGRELLKPPNLARCSPRLFWSLVRAFGPNIPDGLKQLFPQVLEASQRIHITEPRLSHF